MPFLIRIELLEGRMATTTILKPFSRDQMRRRNQHQLRNERDCKKCSRK